MVQRAGRRWRAFYLTSIMVVSTIFYSVAVGPVGADHNFSFGAAGDLDRNTRTTANLRSISTTGLSFFAALGDFSYNGSGTEAMWCDYVKSYVGDAFPFELISGNHEDNGPDGIIDNFANCLPDRIGGITGVYAKEYYFDYPATNPLARMIFVSPNLNFTNSGPYSYRVNGEHYNWTRDAIDDARAKGIRWVIVGMHKACIATGGQTCETIAVTNLLLQRKVDLVLQAHDHNYQRSKQLGCATSGIYVESCVVNDGLSGTYDKGAGTVFVIAGTGGAGRTQVNEQDPEFNYFAKVDNTTYGYAKYSVSLSRIDAEFIGTTRYSPGQMFTDRFSVVGETPDFSMVANPDSLNIAAGSSGTSTITITGTGGFSGRVELTASVSSDGLSASLNPTSVDGSGASTLTVSGSTAATFTVTVTGTSGDLTRTATVTVNVRDFSLRANPTTISFVAGGSATSTITVSGQNGFAGTVTLSSSVSPSGLTCSLNPTSVVLSSTVTSGTSTLSCSGSTAGTFTVTVTGISSSLSRSATVTITVTSDSDYTLSANPTSRTISTGSSGTSTITVNSINNFNSAVALSASVSSNGLSCSLAPTSVTPPAGGPATSTLTCTGSASGSYLVTVMGTSGSLTHSTTVTFSVTQPDFSITASPTSLRFNSGESATATITITAQSGFTDTVTLTAATSPAGLATTLNPTGVQGSSMSTLTVSGSTVGTFTVTVTGTSGSLSHSVTVSVSVVLPADFTISANPTSVSFEAGSTGRSTITLASENGFTGSVSLRASTSPTTGLSCSLSPSTVTLGDTASSILSCPGSTTLTFSVTVTGTSGSLVRSVSLTVAVTDFSISSSRSSLTIRAGSSGTSTISIASLNGFSGDVSLTVSVEPTGIISVLPPTASLDPEVVHCPAGGTVSSTLTVESSLLTTPGTYRVTVTARSGSVSHSTTIDVTVTLL